MTEDIAKNEGISSVSPEQAVASNNNVNSSVSSGISDASNEGKAHITFTPEQQLKVNDLLKVAKQEAAEKSARQTLLAIQEQLKDESGRGLNSDAANKSDLAKAGFTEEQINQIASLWDKERKAQEAEKEREIGTKLYNNFESKLDEAEVNYPDIKKKAIGLGVYKIPQLMLLLNNVDNTADVINELEKIENEAIISKALRKLSTDPYEAVEVIQKFSNSVKNNKEALSKKSQAKPSKDIISSSVTSTDNGQMTVKDFRLDPRFRV